MKTILDELTNYRDILSERNCNLCGKPILLIPSAAERARKHGGTPSDYINTFPNHAKCELANRKKLSSEAAAARRKRDEDAIVILKRNVKEDWIDDENADVDQQYHDDQISLQGWNAAIEAAINKIQEHAKNDVLTLEDTLEILENLKKQEF